MRYLWLLFILWPFAEIFTFAAVAESLGFLGTVFLCVLAFAAGLVLIQKQGFDTFMRAQDMMRDGKMPVREMFQGLCLVGAGVLLIIPGFLSDIAALFLLLPEIRERLRVFFARRTGNPADKPYEPGVIEGTFERVDE